MISAATPIMVCGTNRALIVSPTAATVLITATISATNHNGETGTNRRGRGGNPSFTARAAISALIAAVIKPLQSLGFEPLMITATPEQCPTGSNTVPQSRNPIHPITPPAHRIRQEAEQWKRCITRTSSRTTPTA